MQLEQSLWPMCVFSAEIPFDVINEPQLRSVSAANFKGKWQGGLLRVELC